MLFGSHVVLVATRVGHPPVNGGCKLSRIVVQSMGYAMLVHYCQKELLHSPLAGRQAWKVVLDHGYARFTSAPNWFSGV